MSHISTLSAAMFTSLVVSTNTNNVPTALPVDNAAAALTFQTISTNAAGSLDGTTTAATGIQIKNVKEFPAIGTPANIVKVPIYGSKTSQQINGQADLNNMELTLNFIPGDWVNNTYGGIVVGDGVLRMFRFTLANKASKGLENKAADGSTSIAYAADGSGAAQNSSYYFLGKVEALEVTPSLTDALTAKLTISIQSEIKGAYTVGTN